MEEQDKIKKYGLLYSGGYDSVALLDLLLKDEEIKDLTVIFERCPSMQGEAEYTIAKRTFSFLKHKHKREDIKVRWIQEDIDLSCIGYNKAVNDADILLSIHLTTVLRHGEINIFYTGWHKTAIYARMKVAKSLLKFYKDKKDDDYKLYFMEDIFPAFTPESCKIETITYLLDNNIFI